MITPEMREAASDLLDIIEQHLISEFDLARTPDMLLKVTTVDAIAGKLDAFIQARAIRNIKQEIG